VNSDGVPNLGVGRLPSRCGRWHQSWLATTKVFRTGAVLRRDYGKPKRRTRPHAQVSDRVDRLGPQKRWPGRVAFPYPGHLCKDEF
jgi:hypothetical protein